MREKILLIVISILLISFASAEIIITQQPKAVYNLGDVIEIPIKIVALNEIKDILKVNLICNGEETEVYKSGVKLTAGEETIISPVIIFDKKEIKNPIGICSLKAFFKTDYTLTNNFVISELIIIKLNEQKDNFNPGEVVNIGGEAIKENNEKVEGMIKLDLSDENMLKNIDFQDSVNNGKFKVNFSIPKDLDSGQHTIKINVYERDIDGEILNSGNLNYNIMINQIPTSLVIITENSSIEPGTNLRAKAILYDQSGKKISSNVIISINKNGKVLYQTNKLTDEFLNYSTEKNEAPAELSIVAVSNKLTAESKVKILEKKDVKIEIVNKTITFTNTGNVQYDKEVMVKIGNEVRPINVSLGVGKKEAYVLSAPDGEYEIEVITDGKREAIMKVMLTGDAIDIKKSTEKIVEFARHPFVWVFILIILIIFAFLIIKRGYRKGIIGNSHSKEKIGSNKSGSLFKTNSKAEISSSIHGEKQEAVVLNVKIKNFKEINSDKEESTKEILQKVIKTAEENKASVYENMENIIFVWIPLKTKTEQNEKTALRVAENIKRYLTEYNKLYRQKINFGISLNSGEIIVEKKSDGGLKFMSLGASIITSKRIASISNGEILLSEKIKQKLIQNANVEKIERSGIIAYSLKDVKNNEMSNTFASGFMKRMKEKKSDE